MKKILWIFAAALLTYGVTHNQAQAVLSKASRICLECIGLG